MGVEKKIGIGIVAVVVVVLGVGYLLPAQTVVERSIDIQAPAGIVFNLVNNLKENEKWAPWKEEDSTMATTYGEKVEGVGASSSWTSKKMGDGKMVISESRPNETIVEQLDFGKHGTAESSWVFAAGENGATKATWRFKSDNGSNPIKRYMGALFAKPMIEKSYDKGLANLKRVAEELAKNSGDVVSEPEATAQPARTGATN